MKKVTLEFAMRSGGTTYPAGKEIELPDDVYDIAVEHELIAKKKAAPKNKNKKAAPKNK